MTKTCKQNESKLEAVGKEMQAYKLTIAQVRRINYLILYSEVFWLQVGKFNAFSVAFTLYMINPQLAENRGPSRIHSSILQEFKIWNDNSWFMNWIAIKLRFHFLIKNYLKKTKWKDELARLVFFFPPPFTMERTPFISTPGSNVPWVRNEYW